VDKIELFGHSRSKYRSLAASKLSGHLSYGNADAIINAIGYAEKSVGHRS